MSLDCYWRPIDLGIALRQGDIIVRNGSGLEIEEVGLIINADCDIANGNNEGVINYLTIIPSNEYALKIWAPRQLSKITQKRVRPVLDYLGAVIKKRQSDKLVLDTNSLLNWFADNNVEKVLSQVGIEEKELPKKIADDMTALSFLIYKGYDFNDIDRIKKSILVDKEDISALEASLRGDFDASKGFPDYFFLPSLPNIPNDSYVVLLRSIRSIDATEIYKSFVDAKVDGESKKFHRIGRLADRTKFIISQKLAFLFSRIGLTDEHENIRSISATNAAKKALL